MAVPIYLFTVDAFVLRPKGKGVSAPFDYILEGFTSKTVARSRFDTLVETAKSFTGRGCGVQRVVLRGHRLDGDKPLAVFAASLVTRYPTVDDPPWAVTTAVIARYQERPATTMEVR